MSLRWTPTAKRRLHLRAELRRRFINQFSVPPSFLLFYHNLRGFEGHMLFIPLNPAQVILEEQDSKNDELLDFSLRCHSYKSADVAPWFPTKPEATLPPRGSAFSSDTPIDLAHSFHTNGTEWGLQHCKPITEWGECRATRVFFSPKEPKHPTDKTLWIETVRWGKKKKQAHLGGACSDVAWSVISPTDIIFVSIQIRLTL